MNISVNEVAAVTGAHPATVRRWIRGEGPPGPPDRPPRLDGRRRRPGRLPGPLRDARGLPAAPGPEGRPEEGGGGMTTRSLGRAREWGDQLDGLLLERLRNGAAWLDKERADLYAPGRSAGDP